MSQSSDRLMSIVESFLAQSRQTLTEVASACSLEPATTIRYLRELVARGWLERDEDAKTYSLGVALVTIGAAAQTARPMRGRALPLMRRLLAEFDETVNIATEHRGDVVIIDSLEGGRSIRRGAMLGEKDDWFGSSLGKCILAWMPESRVRELFEKDPPVRHTAKSIITLDAVITDLGDVRERGYALDDEEFEIGLTCVGVPVRTAGGEVTHALSVSGPTHRIQARLAEIVARLQETSHEISAAAKAEEKTQ